MPRASRTAKYAFVQVRLKPARSIETRVWTNALRCARRPARKRKKTDNGTSEQSSPVRLQGLV